MGKNLPISSADVAEQSVRLGSMTVDGTCFYYIEGRPSEKGRSVLMQGSLQGPHLELLPKEFDVRTKVHEYGGKCILAHKGALYFVSMHNQQIYVRLPDGKIAQLTSQPNTRFADFSTDGHNLYAVAEHHSSSSTDNMIVAISLSTYKMVTLAKGYDFYAAPRISPDGKKLAWLSWNHPNMAWDHSELWVGDLSPDLTISHLQKIAGEDEESITSPEWSTQGRLYFSSDKTGFWNLYVYDQQVIHPLTTISKIDLGEPLWILGVARYCILEDESIVAIGTSQGEDALYLISDHTLQKLNIPLSFFSDLYLCGHTLLFKGSSPLAPPSLFAWDLSTSKLTNLKQLSHKPIDPAYISIPKHITFPTQDGLESYGFYYPPTPPCSSPPLILRCHGGPTAHASPKFNLETLFFTSRGFAVFDINYRGSSGYGRVYRNLLRRQWGVADVQDCIHAANYLCKEKLADHRRMIIKGGSAGGFTALCAMTSPSPFAAAVSYYGVSDLNALAHDTHKMELHYVDSLVGPLPEAKDLYDERSPLYREELLSRPILFFQGEEDRVVPPAQSEKMYGILSKKKIPTAYLLFSNEGHGFRQSATIQHCLETEMLFYSRLFGDIAPQPAYHEIPGCKVHVDGINFS